MEIFFEYFARKRERQIKREGGGGHKLNSEYVSFSYSFWNSHRNMKNKIFIAFELLKFDENDIKQ